MVYPYLVILKRESERTLDFISVLLCGWSALNFIHVQIRAGRVEWVLVTIALLEVTGIAINIVLSRRGGGRQVRYKYWLLVAGLGWVAMPYLPWLGILFFFQSFLEYQVKRPLEIGFAPDRVVINTLLRRTYAWSEFNNVVLKDGLLTLDFKNNRLLQKEILDDEDEEDADEDEFNDYCREQLRAADRARVSA